MRRKGHTYDEVSESDASSSSKASLSQFIMDQVALKATEDAKARRATMKQEQLIEASKQEADRRRKRDKQRQAKQSTLLDFDSQAALKSFN